MSTARHLSSATSFPVMVLNVSRRKVNQAVVARKLAASAGPAYDLGLSNRETRRCETRLPTLAKATHQAIYPIKDVADLLGADVFVFVTNHRWRCVESVEPQKQSRE